MSDAHPLTVIEAEARGDDTVEIEWEGLSLTIPASIEDWDLEVMEAFESGQLTVALRGLLGERGYAGIKAAFRDRHGRGIKVGDVRSLGDVIADTYGFDGPGES